MASRTTPMLRGAPMEGRYLANNDAASGGTYTDDTNNFYSKVKDYGNQIKTGTTDLATTDPREWTDNQILGVLTGIIALWSLVLISCIMKGYCDKRRRKKRQQVGIGDKTEALLKKEVKKPSKHKMTRPTVIRAAAPATFGGEFDASDTNKLPLGARLHGAHKLRTDGLTGSGVRVAIIDSGIDHTHPGFHDKVRTKRWYRKGTPLEEDDHGTHVAGTIHFMAPDADLFDYRVFGAEGIDGDLGIANSIRSAVDVDKCHVINMSLRCSYPVRPEVKRAIRYAYKKGVHLVCAAGNSGDGFSFTDETFTFPARFEETISVAAVRKEEGLPATSFSESNAQVDYSGIGRDVVSLKPNGGLQTMSGTSMATPHVTGLIACLLSNSKKYTDKKLRQLLKEKYLVDIGSKGYDKQTGEGFVTYLAGAAGGDKNELFDLLALVE